MILHGGDVVFINMVDSYGDGGGTVTVGDVTATNSGSSVTEACVDLTACNAVDYEATDSWSYENSWFITDLDSTILASEELKMAYLEDV